MRDENVVYIGSPVKVLCALQACERGALSVVRVKGRVFVQDGVGRGREGIRIAVPCQREFLNMVDIGDIPHYETLPGL